jgi:type IV fimbrial biogenesis protein FimT
MHARAHAPKPRGFTLIEMMVVISIMGILFAVAVPSFRSFLAGQEVKSQAFDLSSDLLFARSEALKRGASVSVVPIGGDWTKGWSLQLAANGTVLSQRNAPKLPVVFADVPSTITFNAVGRVTTPAAAVRVTLGSTEADLSQARCVKLDLSGRSNISRGVCS